MSPFAWKVKIGPLGIAWSRHENISAVFGWAHVQGRLWIRWYGPRRRR